MTFNQLVQKKWFAPLFVAILGFVGALGGSLVSGMFQLNQWDSQIAYEKKKAVLEQRVKLLEKLSNVANSAAQMRTYNDYLVLQADLAQIYATCQTNREKGCIKPDEPKVVAEINVKRTELNAEYSSTIQLMKVYFSSSILPVLNELTSRKDWWAPDVEAKFLALVGSASSEIESL
ncbi:hypothetical protein DTO96_101801 [Ephemeroptericola cinctiostellae]|uniref:Uncharacterized protein n=1 Tax=Ephemeroptericola cinctiostellae TaxID=2268024 RepID=A0A345DCH2_9BURK|nr:hypothetical protein [Ephemeroptericola cinctiostellae]AXF86060.1 hypothetical protein DTO96_101801 [Ephemeroptericola cinctiostellae]